MTFIYPLPRTLETAEGCAEVDSALASLASELGLEGGTPLRAAGGNSICVRDVEPPDLWRAMDRAVPDWEDRNIFFAPVFL